MRETRETRMDLEGGCYCGAVRYQAKGDSLFSGQCHCRQCQYISGGHPKMSIGMPEPGFAYTKGSPKEFRRSDIANPVTREFCAMCGTHLLTRTTRVPGAVLVKVGTPAYSTFFGGPRMVIFTIA